MSNMRSNWLIGMKNPNEAQKNQLNSSFTSYTKYNKLNQSGIKLRVITPSNNKKQLSNSRFAKFQHKQLMTKVQIDKYKGSVECSIIDQYQTNNRGTIDSQKILLEVKQMQEANIKSNVNITGYKGLRQAIINLKDFSKQIGLLVKQSIKKMIKLSNQLSLKVQQLHRNYERELQSSRKSLKQAHFQIFSLKLRLQQDTSNKYVLRSQQTKQNSSSIDKPKKQMKVFQYPQEQVFENITISNIGVTQEIEQDILQLNNVLQNMKKCLG